MAIQYRWAFARLAIVSLAMSGGLAIQPSHAQEVVYELAAPPGRHALVIGNASHVHLSALPSAREDMRRVSEQLKALDFNVVSIDGLASADVFNDEVLPKFRSRLRVGDLVVFYFSGHGFSYGPDNFLAPQDLPPTLTRNELADRAIAIEGVQSALARRHPGVLLMLIDACRTVAGFVVSDTAASGLVPKGMAQPLQPSGRGMNTLVGFAARPGTVALGSTQPGQLSVFTAALVSRVAALNREFGTVFDDVSADVRIETADGQEPGLMDWSTSELYLRRDAHLNELEREAWRIARSSNRRPDVERFLRRHAVSAYAAAARQWLVDHPTDVAPSSDVSPLAVDQAWFQSTPTVLSHSDANFAFPARVDAAAVRRLAGIAGDPVTVDRQAGGDSTSDQLALLLAHRQVVTTADMMARSAPSLHAAPLGQVRAGSGVVVQDVQRRSEIGSAWLDVQLPDSGQRGYLPLSGGATPTLRSISLGRSLLEVVAEPMASGLPDLLDNGAITDALLRLSSQGQTVGRVSIVTSGDAAPAKERLDRLSRLNHANYLLRASGVPAAHITAVIDAADFHGNGVRIRFFGQ